MQIIRPEATGSNKGAKAVRRPEGRHTWQKVPQNPAYLAGHMDAKRKDIAREDHPSELWKSKKYLQSTDKEVTHDDAISTNKVRS